MRTISIKMESTSKHKLLVADYSCFVYSERRDKST